MKYVTIPLVVAVTSGPFKWAKEHCPSYIENRLHPDGNNTFNTAKVDYFFEDDRDAIMFILRWS
jgi:hypothetical protein